MSRIILSLFSLGVIGIAVAHLLVMQDRAAADRLTDPAAGWRNEPLTPEAALAGDPGNPYRWSDLGESLAAAGDLDRAKRCMRRAAELGSDVPPVLMRAANFWISEGERAEAMDLMARILVQTDAFDGVIFSYYRRLEIAIADVLAHGLPEDRRTWESYFGNLLAWAEPDAAALPWTSLRRKGWTSDDTAAAYTGFLIRNNQYEDAVAAWAAQLGPRAGDFPAANRLFNGGFERELTGAPLDWVIRPAEGARAVRVPEGADGGWALKVTFDGAHNLVYRHAAQTAYLPPGSWRIEARIRTRAVTTNEGLYLRLASPRPGLAWQSQKLNGTSDGWLTLTHTFRTTAPSTPVTLTLARDESLKIDNKLAGSSWLDDVTLAPIH